MYGDLFCFFVCVKIVVCVVIKLCLRCECVYTSNECSRVFSFVMYLFGVFVMFFGGIWYVNCIDLLFKFMVVIVCMLLL